MHSPLFKFYLDPIFQQIMADAEAKGYFIGEFENPYDHDPAIWFLPEGDWMLQALETARKERFFTPELINSTLFASKAVRASAYHNHLMRTKRKVLGAIEIAFRLGRTRIEYTLVVYNTPNAPETTYPECSHRDLFPPLCEALNITTLENYPLASKIDQLRDACFLLESIVTDPNESQYTKDYIHNFFKKVYNVHNL